MRWDQLLTKIRESGIAVLEQDYLDDYGSFAPATYPGIGGRRFRCTFGRAEIDGRGFEAYAFPSEQEALDFLELARNDAEGPWVRHCRMLLHADPGSRDVLERIESLL